MSKAIPYEKIKYWTYEQARSWCVENVPVEIKTIAKLKKWLSLNKSNIPKQMPKSPFDFYYQRRTKNGIINSGWLGLSDFLGRHTVRYTDKYKTDDCSILKRKEQVITKINQSEDKKDWEGLVEFYKTGDTNCLYSLIIKDVDIENKQSAVKKLLYTRLLKTTGFSLGDLSHDSYSDLWTDVILDFFENAVGKCKLNRYVIERTTFRKWSLSVIYKNIYYLFIQKGVASKKLIKGTRKYNEEIGEKYKHKNYNLKL